LEGKDNIKDMFSNKLGNYEAKVNPELWGKVASQIGTTATTVVGTGISVLTKWLIGIGISTAAITTAVILINTSNTTDTTSLNTPVKQDQSTTQEFRTNQPNTTTLVDADPSVTYVNPDQTDIPLAATSPGDAVSATSGGSEPRVDVKVDPLQINSVAGGVSTSVSHPAIVEGIESLVTSNPAEGLPDYVEPAKASYTIAQYTNVFSPNGDGTNDVFELKIEGVDHFTIVILSAEGKSVFKSNETDFRWNGGDMSGNPVPDGTYVYILTGYDLDGNPVPEYRTLTIVR
jgi:gliding motility-associated-like protein